MGKKNNIIKILDYNYNSKTPKEGAFKRNKNINTFSGLDREGLEYGVKERRLLLYTTSNEEKLYIQYPGKETGRNNGVRPWDFRPKLLNKKGVFLSDLSFANIWDDLLEIHGIDNKVLATLAALFYRMAFMLESELVKEECAYYDFDALTDKIKDVGVINIEWNKLIITEEIFSILKEEIRGVSLEAYLLYIDLLAQNEDCKYYYRDVIERGGDWNPKIGRPSMFLTHISVIQYIKKEIKFSEIMNRFQRQRGVAQIPLKELGEVTEGIIKKEV